MIEVAVSIGRLAPAARIEALKRAFASVPGPPPVKMAALVFLWLGAGPTEASTLSGPGKQDRDYIEDLAPALLFIPQARVASFVYLLGKPIYQAAKEAVKPVSREQAEAEYEKYFFSSSFQLAKLGRMPMTFDEWTMKEWGTTFPTLQSSMMNAAKRGMIGPMHRVR